jgi:hypothetical protein
MIILFSTSVTPGADHAASSSAFLSAYEHTVPRKMTLLPEIDW